MFTSDAPTLSRKKLSPTVGRALELLAGAPEGITDFEGNAAEPEDSIDPKWLKDDMVSKPDDL
jgi:hypothetical protein